MGLGCPVLRRQHQKKREECFCTKVQSNSGQKHFGGSTVPVKELGVVGIRWGFFFRQGSRVSVVFKSRVGIFVMFMPRDGEKEKNTHE